MTTENIVSNNIESSSKSITAESLVDRLRDALKTNGDFPVSARIVNEISSLTKNPSVTAEQLSNVILKDPTLGVRLLSVVNSSYYTRARPIMTVSQAIVHIGLNQLADLCANLILLQSFVPTARQGGVFANSLRKAILGSVLTELISIQLSSSSKDRSLLSRTETGYLLGFFGEMGTLLLAYYYPQVYAGAVKRAETRNIGINRSIMQLIGVTPIQIAIEIARALELPPYYAEVLGVASEIKNDPSILNTVTEEVKLAATAVYIADALAGLLAPERRKKDLDNGIYEVASHVGVDPNLIPPILVTLQRSFEEYCNTLELTFPPLPSFLDSYEESMMKAFGENSTDEESISDTVREVRELVESGESVNSVITAVMEAMAWSLGFDRVILLMADASCQNITGHMGLGDLGDYDVQAMCRPLTNKSSPYAVETIAYRDGRPIFHGDPILPKGWPLTALPIGSGENFVGIIYGDKVNTTEDELPIQQQAALSTLADLLDQAITIQERSGW